MQCIFARTVGMITVCLSIKPSVDGHCYRIGSSSVPPKTFSFPSLVSRKLQPSAGRRSFCVPVVGALYAPIRGLTLEGGYSRRLLSKAAPHTGQGSPRVRICRRTNALRAGDRNHRYVHGLGTGWTRASPSGAGAALREAELLLSRNPFVYFCGFADLTKGTVRAFVKNCDADTVGTALAKHCSRPLLHGTISDDALSTEARTSEQFFFSSLEIAFAQIL